MSKKSKTGSSRAVGPDDPRYDKVCRQHAKMCEEVWEGDKEIILQQFARACGAWDEYDQDELDQVPTEGWKPDPDDFRGQRGQRNERKRARRKVEERKEKETKRQG